MQDLSHIITSSNALSKKLAFQGWEKCVEAFSQGKGSLSHHCTRLLHSQELSQQEEIISWSSSEEESDEACRLSRSRPARTLLSQIDFSECSSVRRKGRRQSAARFRRSIEKQALKNLESHTNVVSTQLCSEESNLESSQSSLLNRRIVLMCETQNSEELLGTICSEKNLLTPDSSHGSDKPSNTFMTSPVFKSSRTVPKLRSRVTRGTFTHPNALDKKKTGHYLDNCASGSLCSSFLPLKSFSPEISIGRLKSPEVASREPSDTRSPVLGKSAARRMKNLPKMAITESLSPILEKGPLLPLANSQKSPILGYPKKTMPIKRKRKGSLKGVLNETEINQKSSCVASQSDKHEDINSTITLPKWSLANGSLEENDILTVEGLSAKRSLDFSSPKHHLRNRKDPNTDQELVLLNEGISAVEVQCDTPDTDVIASSLSRSPELITHRRRSRNFKNKTCKGPTSSSSVVATPLDEKQKIYPLNPREYSRIIEEENTEKLQAVQVNHNQPIIISNQKKKRKSLSLKKNPVIFDCPKNQKDISLLEKSIESTSNLHASFIKQDSATIKKRGLQILSNPISCQGKEASGTKRVLKPNSCDIDDEFSQNYPKVDTKEGNVPIQGLRNLTCYIEDVLSEFPYSPCEAEKNQYVEKDKPSVYEKKITVEDQLQGKVPNQDSSEFRPPVPAAHHNSFEDKLEIDSCSSQSPDDPLPLQSNRPASPISISQSSSPPGPCPALPQARPPPPDDFDTPPKKGKKKLQPGGLAHRLQRLVNRQRSSARIWQFQRSKQNREKSDSSGGNRSDDVVHGKSDATVIHVHHTWIEYSHAIVQGSLSEALEGESSLSNRVVVVLDSSVFGQLGPIILASVIRIYPPWLSFCLGGSSVILSATRVEIVRTNPPSKEAKMKCISLKEFHCPCVDGLLQPNCSEHNNLSLKNLDGLPIKVLDLLFPHVQEKALSSLNTVKETHVAGERPSVQESIMQVVTNHCSGEIAMNWLSATVLRIFKYWPASRSENDGTSPTWSLLVQDALGDFCEVALDPGNSSQSAIWDSIESGGLLGKTCRFFGFIPKKRIYPFRAFSLWSITHTITGGSCRQNVLYVLSPSQFAWECSPVQERGDFSLHFSDLEELADKLETQDPHRFNIKCRLLHSNPKVLYVTDLSVAPRVVTIVLHPSAFLPLDISSALVLNLLDIEVVSGEIRADKYSRINVLNSSGNEGLALTLASLNPKLPSLQLSLPTRSLTSVVGTIVGVDEETAFMWPACGHCGNELLCAEAASETYKCKDCINVSEKVVLRMSLQVILSCRNLPKTSSIRIKLLQSTIEKLLPSSSTNEGGYDMNTVLGHQLGPLNCEILSSKAGDFLLQELPPFR